MEGRGIIHAIQRSTATGATTPATRTITTRHPTLRLPIRITERGRITDFSYDASGNLLEKTDFEYDGVGQRKKVTLPTGAYLSYTYDPAHRLTDVEDNLGNTIHYTLDLMGNRTQEDTRDPQGTLRQTHARVYNPLNRLIKDIGAAGQTTQYGYDNNGNLTTQTDPLNRVTTSTYDKLNRLVDVRDPLLGHTDTQYDPLDQVTRIIDPLGSELLAALGRTPMAVIAPGGAAVWIGELHQPAEVVGAGVVGVGKLAAVVEGGLPEAV